jgi:hypothetical protein
LRDQISQNVHCVVTPFKNKGQLPPSGTNNSTRAIQGLIDSFNMENTPGFFTLMASGQLESAEVWGSTAAAVGCVVSDGPRPVWAQPAVLAHLIMTESFCTAHTDIWLSNSIL